MIPGILTSTGNLGGLTPHQIVVKPICGEAFSAGALVKFDLADASASTDLAFLTDLDNKKNPFNVVVKADGGEEVGIFGVALEAGVVGSRVSVCIDGLVDATVTTTTTTNPCTAGTTPLIPSDGVLSPAPATRTATDGVAIAIPFTSSTTTQTLTMKVLLHGYAFGLTSA